MNGPRTEITEADWQGLVVTFATFNRWSVYHTRNSQGSAPGFPDLVMIRVPEILVVELKTERGKVTTAQQEWLDAFAACGLEVHTWRPSDWPEVESRLRRDLKEAA